MGFLRTPKRDEHGPVDPAFAKLNRLTTPDLYLAAEQSIMAAGRFLSEAMSSADPLPSLVELDLQLRQAKVAVEVLAGRG